jgi:hypothetical protein
MKKLILAFLSLFLLIQPVRADLVAKDKVVVLDNFSGGLNSQLSPYSLPPTQSIIAENVRLNEEGNSLSKRQKTLLYGTADATEAVTGLFRLYLKNSDKVLLVTHGDEIEKGADSTGAFTNILDLTTGNYRWQWTTWNNVAIGTDGYNQPVKYDGSSASATYLGTALATATATGAGPSGTYHYKVSFYTTTYEVEFNVASNPVTVTNKDISLSMIPIAPDNYGGETVVGRKIYRHKTGATTYYLLSNGTIADNSTLVLTDSDTDGELSATSYPATSATVKIATPPKGKLCLIHYNRLFIANDPSAPSRLYYSDDGSPDYFLPTDYYLEIRPDDGDQITFIKTFLGVLTVGKENSIQKVFTDGASPAADWSISNVFTREGCKAMYSAQDTPVGIIYLGSDGLYKFTGQYSTLLSNSVAPEIKDILESNRPYVWAVYHKNVYYLSYPSKKTSVAYNNRVLLFDLVTNAFSIDIISANCFAAFNSGTDWDTLYYGSSTDGKVYNYTFQAYEVNHKTHSDFTGTFTNARYIPVGITGGDVNYPIIEIARTGTINALSGTINALVGTIDRDSLTGSYVSQAMNTGASSYDKLYWNEQLISSGDDVTIAVRSASTEAGLTAASWSSEYSDPSGSDISALTAGAWTQYRISLTTDAYAHSPNLLNYVKLTYLKEAETSETTIPFRWETGWLDFQPGYKKILRKIQIYYAGDKGTVNIKFSNSKGDTDTFAINMVDNPNFYEGYFATGLADELFEMEVTNNDLNPLTIYKIILTMDLLPLQ